MNPIMALSMAFCVSVSVFHLGLKWTERDGWPVIHRLVSGSTWKHKVFSRSSCQASVGRLGPLQVAVERNSPKLPELQKAKGMAWWIGTRSAVACCRQAQIYC